VGVTARQKYLLANSQTTLFVALIADEDSVGRFGRKILCLTIGESFTTPSSGLSLVYAGTVLL
jgi:hypothetical protein